MARLRVGEPRASWKSRAGPRSPGEDDSNPDDVMKIRRTVWGIIVVAAAAGSSTCGQGDASGDAPASVLTAERAGQEANGAPRPGAGGVVRTTTLDVGGIAVSAEIADTPALREHGLMERDSLPENHGMLFVYPDERPLSFWMRNTPIDLDIAFMDRTGTILNIATMQANDDSSHVSEGPAMYALEMESGWFEVNGIEAGTRVKL
jgi:uncharacterized membrane protein (UPF0127 family)